MAGGSLLSVKAINPYLFFNGNAADAVSFYEKAIDAKVVRLARYSDSPGFDAAEHANKVMHAHLETGGGTLLLSDGIMGPANQHGDGICVCLQYEGRADVDRHFAALSEGGKVLEALQDTFWGARFGLLVDKFGIHWMFNATLNG
jgi:PhnB protein